MPSKSSIEINCIFWNKEFASLTPPIMEFSIIVFFNEGFPYSNTFLGLCTCEPSMTNSNDSGFFDHYNTLLFIYLLNQINIRQANSNRIKMARTFSYVWNIKSKRILQVYKIPWNERHHWMKQVTGGCHESRQLNSTFLLFYSEIVSFFSQNTFPYFFYRSSQESMGLKSQSILYTQTNYNLHIRSRCPPDPLTILVTFYITTI